jgi:hypothetical protein
VDEEEEAEGEEEKDKGGLKENGSGRKDNEIGKLGGNQEHHHWNTVGVPCGVVWCCMELATRIDG